MTSWVEVGQVIKNVISVLMSVRFWGLEALVHVVTHTFGRRAWLEWFQFVHRQL